MPTANDFNTVPDELLHVAVDAATFFEDQGFGIHIERRDIGVPFVPAFVAEMGHETHIVEVTSKCDPDRCERWVRYCQSQEGDTRFHLAIRGVPDLEQKSLDIAISKRLGLLHHNDERLQQIREAADLAVHVALPEITDLHRKLRPLLAKPFKKIREGDWRDGLEGAYHEVEQLARDYLREGVASGTIEVVAGSKRAPRDLLAEEVDAMTLGALRIAFSNIKKKNQKDSLIEATIGMINQSRIALVHRRNAKEAEEGLRRSIGRNIYAVIGCLEALLDV